MKNLHLFVAFILLVNPGGLLQAQEPPLAYRLQTGESYFLLTDLQQSTHSESMDREEISFYNLTRVEYTVDSVDLRGHFHMSVRYRDLLISMLAPQLKIDISSASGRNQLLSEMVDMLEQSDFQAVMTPRGELLGLEGLEENFARLASLPVKDTAEHQVIFKTLEETYGPDAFKSLHNLFVWIYPVLYPMSNWTNDITYHFNTKPVQMVNRYVLAKFTEDIIVIQGLGMLNSKKEFFETTGMGKVKSTVSGSQTYDFQMDLESGWLNRCISRQRVTIETTILESNYLPSGLRIPSYTETVFELSGGKMEKNPEKQRK
ncbi:MAG: DUF6263 family protein [Bacteroidales bacterium]|nr:DUF6263 family protein [Bacteroidales bacterium]